MVRFFKDTKIKYAVLAAFAIASCEASREAGEFVPEIKPETAIDYSYPNKWRGPELTHSDYRMQVGNRPCPAESGEVKYIDPLPVIIDYAKNNQIIMINESHYKPLHRVFIGEVSKELKKHGYLHYGAEMLGHQSDTKWLNSDTGLRGIGYLSSYQNSIRYWQDPIFGQVMENLSKAKFRFFGYEGDYRFPPKGTTSGIAFRDNIQAQNIQRYVESAGSEKVIIHAGYHHIKESNQTSNEKWMAERFTEKTGINPLTISQTDCVGGFYLKEGLLGYGLLADGQGNPISRHGYDLILAAPIEEQYKERPVWLRDELGRIFTELPEAAKFDGPSDFTLITAREMSRPDGAPPEDIIFRAPHSDKVLALRPGSYKVDVTDRHKEILKSVRITVTK